MTMDRENAYDDISDTNDNDNDNDNDNTCGMETLEFLGNDGEEEDDNDNGGGDDRDKSICTTSSQDVQIHCQVEDALSDARTSNETSNETSSRQDRDRNWNRNRNRNQASSPSPTFTFTVDSVLTQVEAMVETSVSFITNIKDKDKDKEEKSILQSVKEEMFTWWAMQSTQQRNKMVFAVTLVTVLPLTRRAIVSLFEKMIYFILTIVGTTIGIAVGIGLGLKIYNVLHEDSERGEGEGEGEGEGHDDMDEVKVFGIPRANWTSTSTPSASVSVSRRSSMSMSNSGAATTSASVPTSTSTSNNNNSLESDSYIALMASAGYAMPISTNTIGGPDHATGTHLRGQILRNITPEKAAKFAFVKTPNLRNSVYQVPSIDNTDANSCIRTGTGNENENADEKGGFVNKGILTFQRLCPDLPMPIQKELGIMVDLVVRDYIMSWYHFMDDAVAYENEKEKRARLEQRQREGISPSSSTSQSANNVPDTGVGRDSDGDGATHVNENASSPTTSMILSTTPLRVSPFLEIFYNSLTTLLGDFATLCENVNVPHLILVKFMHILKVNIRTFKDIRKIATEKQIKKMGMGMGKDGKKERDRSTTANIRATEIAIVREYLLRGMFHKAITFGMDVPGLLFGDALGQACPIPDSHKDGLQGGSYIYENESEESTRDEVVETGDDADAVLQQRLFGNGRRILHECELDYNRLLSHRLCRVLLPRADFASPMLRNACVEMMAACVLTPTMGCFTPDFVNGWIVKLLDGTTTSTNQAEDAGADDSSEPNEAIEQDPFEIDEADGDNSDDILNLGTSLEDDEHIFDGSEIEESTFAEEQEQATSMDTSDEIVALLAMSLIELQAYIDFDEARGAHESGQELGTRWDDQGCIETVRNLVLVIEAMLMNGVLLKRRKKKPVINPPTEEKGGMDADDFAVEEEPSRKEGKCDVEYTSLIVMLMEMTSDLDAFENEVKNVDEDFDVKALYEEDGEDIRSLRRPKLGDLSTLRTLIAAWLHTGMIFRVISVLVHSGLKILHPFYHEDAFIRRQQHVDGFLRQLRILDRVDILVDTMTLLSYTPLDLFQLEENRLATSPSSTPNMGFFPATSSTATKSSSSQGSNKNAKIKVNNMTPGKLQSTLKTKMKEHQVNQRKAGLNGIKANFENNRKRLTRLVRPGDGRHEAPSPSNSASISSPSVSPISHYQNSAGEHLKFHGNEVLASSLRVERDARMNSFSRQIHDSDHNKRLHIEMICRSRVTSENHFKEHRDLHNLAKGFYSNTNMLSLRLAKAVGKDNEEEIQTMLLMESVTTRRKMDIPDDDSSFLLRAQPRPLTVVNVHRDQRSHNLSYKKYAAYFDEPIVHTKSNTFRGARLRRKCFLRYYPNDRTASINFIKGDRSLDEKLGRLIQLETAGTSKQIKEFERYLCNKVFRKGSERPGGPLSNSILASTVMDSNDFCSIPRSGKAADFVYRMSLFEEPEVELAGKTIVVQGASAVGFHQADASSLEMSDAALSTAIILGEKYNKRNRKHFHVICNDNTIPIVFLKLADQAIDPTSPLSVKSQRKNEDGDLRPYKASFVRAALMVMSARKEAQLQCLISGSAKNATRSRTDQMLRPTLTLLDYATSRAREKQSILLRDLKLGINHIDREQLKRSGILNPRYPTRLKQLRVAVVGAVEVKSSQNIDLLAGPSTILYKLRCIAITEFVGVDGQDNDMGMAEYGDLLREEWVILRPFRDFTALHKFLKSQVNSSEASAGTGAKIVGAATGLATAALTLGTSPHNYNLKRKVLIPSLSQGVKAGALVATKKSIEKRKEVLNEYLGHLLSPGNLLNRCPELLRFVGAYDPLPDRVKLGGGVFRCFTDTLGRSEMSRSFLQRSLSLSQTPASTLDAPIIAPSPISDGAGLQETLAPFVAPVAPECPERSGKKSKKLVDPEKLAVIEAIKPRIDCVKLGQVRGSVFELIRYIFDLDNANFFRSQMVGALKTMSIAITSAGHGFKRTLLEAHLKYINSESISSYIKLVRDLVWPNGVIFTSAIPLTPKESLALSKKSRALMRQHFPDQLMAVLGSDITENGLDLLHEMFQNRLVLKSMIYMMLDALLFEIFPEIGDVLTASKVMDDISGITT